MNFFDLHCDTAYECYKRNLPFNNDLLSVREKDAENFEHWVQAFAVWIADDTPNPFGLYRKILADIKCKLKNHPQNLTPVFSVEGGAVLESDIERTEILAKDGIKMLTLTWNGENNLAGGINSTKGLTAFGREVIKSLNRLNIATDLSHLNEKSFYTALEYAQYPIATHSNVFEICPHKRNLKTEQIKLLAQKGGIMGLTLYPAFLGENVLEGLYKNICFLCELGLEKHIAVGTDFDGGEMGTDLNNMSKIPLLYEFLKAKGLQDEILQGVFYKNAEKFIAKLR